METESIIRVASQAMVVCLMVSLPAVIVSAVVGLLVSFVQAITSLQDQAISQSIKLIAVVIALLVSAPWGASTIVQFAQKALDAAVGRL